MKTLVFLLEEPSAREMLCGILSKLLPDDITPRYMVFEGKQDLEKRLIRRIRGWNTPDSLFVVMRDQDSGNCIEIKNGLLEKCQKTGKKALIRIACRELESFYLGDLSAVEKGLGIKGLARKQDKSKFRNPDQLGSPAEELKTLTSGKYQKLSGSRAIAPHLDLDNKRSHSFGVLVSGLRHILNIGK